MSKDLEQIGKTKKNSIYFHSMSWGIWFLSILINNQFKDNMSSQLSVAIQVTGMAFMFISMWFIFRLFRINRLEVKNPKIANQLNDETEQITRLKSLANGFIACIVVYTIYLLIAATLESLFNNPSYSQLSGVFTGGMTLTIAYFVAVFTYFRQNQQ